MNEVYTFQPITDETLLLIFGGLVFLALAGGICLTLVFQKNTQLIIEFRKTDFLYIITVFAVVITTAILGLRGILDAKSTSTILGAVVGFVLGSLRKHDQM